MNGRMLFHAHRIAAAVLALAGVPALVAVLALAAVPGAARAGEPDESAALAALAETYEHSLVTLSWSRPLAGAPRTRIAVVVGDGLVMAPSNEAAGELGVNLRAADGIEYPVDLVLADDLLGVEFWRLRPAEVLPELEAVHFPKAPRVLVGVRVAGLSPLPPGYTSSVSWRSSRVNAEQLCPVHSYLTEQPIGVAGTLVCNVQGAPVGILLDAVQDDPGVTIHPADHFHQLITDAAGEGVSRPDRRVPSLGVDLQAIGPSLAAALGLPATGCARVTRVLSAPDGGEESLRVGDIVVRVDGLSLAPVREDADLLALAHHFRRRVEGEQAVVKVLRLPPEPGGEPASLELTVPIVEIPGTSHRRLPSLDVPGFGMLARPEGGEGVVVSSIVPGAAADLAGLMRGDRIESLDGELVSGIEPLLEAARSMQETGAAHATVHVVRGGIGSFHRLALGAQDGR